MSVSSEYSNSTIEEYEFLSIEHKATYGFTDEDLAPFTVAGLRKEAKKKGLSNDEIKKVIKQRRRVKVRKYSKNFRAREQQQMADMEVEIRVLNIKKQKLIDEKSKLMSESAKFKELVFKENNPMLLFTQQQQQQQQQPQQQQQQQPFFPISNLVAPKMELIDSTDLKRGSSMASPCYSYFGSPSTQERYSY